MIHLSVLSFPVSFLLSSSVSLWNGVEGSTFCCWTMNKLNGAGHGVEWRVETAKSFQIFISLFYSNICFLAELAEADPVLRFIKIKTEGSITLAGKYGDNQLTNIVTLETESDQTWK